MKFLMVFLSVFISNAAFAHTDHALGEGSLHLMYHVVFWCVFAAVVYKGVCWFKASKKTKEQK